MMVILVHVSKATSTIKTRGSVMANGNTELVPLIMTDYKRIDWLASKHKGPQT